MIVQLALCCTYGAHMLAFADNRRNSRNSAIIVAAIILDGGAPGSPGGSKAIRSRDAASCELRSTRPHFLPCLLYGNYLQFILERDPFWECFDQYKFPFMKNATSVLRRGVHFGWFAANLVITSNVIGRAIVCTKV